MYSSELFILNKKRIIDENINFKDWMKNNKAFAPDGTPIIGFHGSTSESFNVIDFNKSNDDWWVGKGFYTSSCAKDVSANYATAQLKKDGSYKSADLGGRIDRLSEKMQHLFNADEECDLYLGISQEELNEILEDGFISLESACAIKNGEWTELAKSLSKDNEFLLIEDFVKEIITRSIIKNEGWITPVYIKMERPVYYTIDDSATKVFAENDDIRQFKYDNDSLFYNLQEFIGKTASYLQEINNGDIINSLSEESLMMEVQSSFSELFEESSSEAYNVIYDLIELNEYDFEVDVNLEEISSKIKHLMVESDMINWEDEEDEILGDGVFCFFEESDNTEQKELYDTIKGACLNLAEGDYLLNIVEDFFRKIETNSDENGEALISVNDDGSVNLYDIFKQSKIDSEPELLIIF